MKTAIIAFTVGLITTLVMGAVKRRRGKGE